jgi:S-adenosylmethionine:tRNA-ribosyltransferase-isomerase (queuine synthetase)
VVGLSGAKANCPHLTGFRPPHSSHLQLLSAVVGEELLARCYTEAVAAGYRWHEFGDLNLLFPVTPRHFARAVWSGGLANVPE